MTESSAPEGEMPLLPEPAHYIATEARSRGMYPAYRNLQARKQFAPQGEFQFSFTAEQMHAYAREYAATSAAQAAGGGAVPVAWIREEDLAKLRELGANADVALLAFKRMHFTIPLYTAAPDHPSPSREGPSDAEMLDIIDRYGIRHGGKFSDPAKPYSIRMTLPDHGTTDCCGATIRDAARNAIDWLKARNSQ